MMIWKELLGHIQVMDEEQLKSEVNLCTEDEEYFPVISVELSYGHDGLANNQPFLQTETKIAKL